LAFAGAVAVGAALAIGELIAGLVAGVPSPLLAVARFIVDIQPPGAKELVVGLFGESDKLAFQVFIVLVAIGVGAVLGRMSGTRPAGAAAVVVAFTGAGFAASLREPGVEPALSVAAAAIEAIVGIYLLRRLAALAGTRSTAGEPAAGVSPSRPSMPDWSRRSLLQAGGAIAVGSVVAGSIGRALLEGQRAPATAEGIPAAPQPAVLPPGADLSTRDLEAGGLSGFVFGIE
jgi:hypothetical protein